MRCSNLKYIGLSAISLVFLSGCLLNGPYPYKLAGGLLFATSEGIFADLHVNLKEKNYAAADFLQSKFGKNLTHYHVIKALPLEELDHPGISSPLGRNIAEGVGLRLSEIGYNVLLQDVAPYDNKELYPPLIEEQKPAFLLKGYYAVKTKEIEVILQTIEVRTNKVIARFDYAMPLSREIKKLAQTQPRIFRIKGEEE